MLVDENLRPWLLEVNASPSLGASNREDLRLKKQLVGDVLDIVDVEGRQGISQRMIPESVVDSARPITHCILELLVVHKARSGGFGKHLKWPRIFPIPNYLARETASCI